MIFFDFFVFYRLNENMIEFVKFIDSHSRVAFKKFSFFPYETCVRIRYDFAKRKNDNRLVHLRIGNQSNRMPMRDDNE